MITTYCWSRPSQTRDTPDMQLKVMKMAGKIGSKHSVLKHETQERENCVQIYLDVQNL